LILSKKRTNNFFLSADQIDKLKFILFKSYHDKHHISSDLKTVKKWFQNKNVKKPSFIFVISSGVVPLRLIRLGYKLSQDYEVPFILHSTDPLPSPRQWGEKQLYRKAVLRAIKHFYKKANLICASNPIMLNYQLEELGLQNKKSMVIYNPIENWKELDTSKIKKNSFLYLGSIYGKRNPQFLIDGFISFLDSVCDAKLIFVGSNINLENYNIPNDKKSNFGIVPWTDQVDNFIAEAEVLIDFNANIEEDVYLSSKLSKYLSYNRKIFCVCAENSAPDLFISSDLNFTTFKTIYSKSSFEKDLLNTLIHKGQDWESRKDFIKTYSIQNQIFNLLNVLK
jgi:glycosyltransferase involved in cell wall biosynthesis